jgi:hypothetical protein
VRFTEVAPAVSLFPSRLMKNKPIMLGLLALFVLLVVLMWKFYAVGGPVLPASPTAPTNPGLAAQPSQQPPVVVAAPKTAVEMPTQPPAPAAETTSASLSDEDPSVNDLGDLEFTDGVPVVRTLASGETCIMVATAIPPSGSGDVQVSVNMLIEAPGSVPAIDGLLGQAALNAEYRAAAMDSHKKILSNHSVTAIAGHEVEIGVGSPGDPAHFSIRFKPKMSGQ